MEKFQTRRSMRYKPEEVWFPLSETILDWNNDFHTLMLNDKLRMNAYQKAIYSVVKSGVVVADIGTGTGILAKWALDAGARMVYGIEANQNRIAAANNRIKKAGYQKRFQLINGLSYKVNLFEKVDVIISELLGNLGDNEDMVPILADARQRFLKPNGKMLPAQVQSCLVPVTSTATHRQIKKGQVKSINSQYDLAKLMASLGTRNGFNLYYDAIIPRAKQLSNPKTIQQFNFDGHDRASYSVSIDFPITHAGLFTGFKGFFTAKLSEKVALDISSDDISGRQTSDCWKHAYLPIESPCQVQKGDIIRVEFSRYYPKKKASPFGQGYSWKGSVLRGGKIVSTFSQQTTK